MIKLSKIRKVYRDMGWLCSTLPFGSWAPFLDGWLAAEAAANDRVPIFYWRLDEYDEIIVKEYLGKDESYVWNKAFGVIE